METCTSKFIRYLITGNNTHVITGNNLSDLCHTHGKSLTLQYICSRLMSLTNTNTNFMHLADTTPSRIHSIGSTIFIISSDNKHRLRISKGLCPKILSHNNLFFSPFLNIFFCRVIQKSAFLPFQTRIGFL